jgi:hypothetical protein
MLSPAGDSRRTSSSSTELLRHERHGLSLRRQRPRGPGVQGRVPRARPEAGATSRCDGGPGPIAAQAAAVRLR